MIPSGYESEPFPVRKSKRPKKEGRSPETHPRNGPGAAATARGQAHEEKTPMSRKTVVPPIAEREAGR